MIQLLLYAFLGFESHILPWISNSYEGESKGLGANNSLANSLMFEDMKILKKKSILPTQSSGWILRCYFYNKTNGLI